MTLKLVDFAKRKRRRRQQPEERSAVVGVRLTPTERQELERLAGEAGLTPSSYLRALLLEQG